MRLPVIALMFWTSVGFGIQQAVEIKSDQDAFQGAPGRLSPWRQKECPWRRY